MNRNCQTLKFSSHDPDRRDTSQLVWLHGWTRMPALLRSQTTLAALAILAILGLMLAFHQVVRGAVARGELLQQARNLQGEALSRCSSLRSFAARDNCMRQAQLKGSAELSQ